MSIKRVRFGRRMAALGDPRRATRPSASHAACHHCHARHDSSVAPSAHGKEMVVATLRDAAGIPSSRASLGDGDPTRRNRRAVPAHRPQAGQLVRFGTQPQRRGGRPSAPRWPDSPVAYGHHGRRASAPSFRPVSFATGLRTRVSGNTNPAGDDWHRHRLVFGARRRVLSTVDPGMGDETRCSRGECAVERSSPDGG
jgi:hypothetical protein